MRDLSIAEQCIPRKCKDDLVSRRQVYRLKLASDNDWEFGQALMDMPSAEPEKQHGRIFQGIIVEYPTISTYPGYEGKPYFSIKYTENGQEFIGYGTYKPEVLSEYLKEYFMPSAQPEQIARDIATIIENEQDMRVVLKNERTETHSCDYQRTETHDLVSRQSAIDSVCEVCENCEYFYNEKLIQTIKDLPSAQPDSKYEYHYDHTDCIWYRPEARNRCPVTCAQYRDGWNDAMNYIFRDGKGYRPYRRDKQYEG